MREDLVQLFPGNRQAFWAEVVKDAERIQEIRLRIGCPVIVKREGAEWYLDEQGHFAERADRAHLAGEQEMEELLGHICHDSPYAFEDELRQGFLTVPGGHRIGVAGQAVLESDGTLRTMKHIYYINIRIAHQIFGAADPVLSGIYEDGELQNTLIVSPPGCGKTTMLRELVRRISDGNRFGKGLSVGVVDERSELAGSYLGKPQNDLGRRTDVLDACPKAKGMLLLLRSMSPQVIAVDELGGREDEEALRIASACGSRIIATVHGKDLRDVAQKFPEFVKSRIFERVLVLGKKDGQPCVMHLYRGEELARALFGRNHDCGRLSGDRAVVSGAVDRKNSCSAQPGIYFGDAHERDPLRKIHASGVL